jgi:hypothetical protein
MLKYELREEPLDKSLFLYLKLANLDVEFPDDTRHSYLRFTVRTYNNFKTIDVVKNNVIFKPVNEFFDTLTLNEQSIVARILISMNALIQFTFNSDSSGLTLEQLETDLGVLTSKLSDCLDVLDQQIDLFNKIHRFVQLNIPIYKEEDLGTRAQDSEEMTFYNDQIEVLTALVVLCKILTPIFGELIDKIKNLLDNSLKEMHCSLILTPIIKRHMFDLKLKLDNYFLNIIKPKETIDRIYHMHNENVTVSIVQAMVFVRRFISMDIYNPASKLMVYISYCARSASNTQKSNTTKKMSVRERLHPFEVFGDDGNTSKLENDSQYSKTSMDNPIIIMNNTRLFIEQAILELNIDPEVINLMVNDYNNKSLPITEMNKYLLCIAFGRQLEGAKSINHLYRNEYIRLLSILQIKLFYTSMHKLIPLLSLIPSRLEKQHITTMENEIRIYWPQSPEYRLCKEKYSIAVDKKIWDNKLKEIVELLTMNTYYQYYPPIFLDLVDHQFESNLPYELTLDTISLLCRFIYEST